MPTASQVQTDARLSALAGALLPWQNEALRSLLNGISPQLSFLVAEARADINRHPGLAQGPVTPEPIRLETETATICLVSLSGILNVNQLASDQALSFAPKLTLVFGENASGKSGYVRVLKSAFGSRSSESILANAYLSVEPQKAQAIFEFVTGSSEPKSNTHTWVEGEVAEGPFKAFACFDTKAASIYLEKENTLAFRPAVCDALSKLAVLSDRVRDELTITAKALEDGTTNGLTPPEHCSLADEISSISAATPIESLLAKLVWTEEDNSCLKLCEAELREVATSSTNELVAKYEAIFKALLEIYKATKEREEIANPAFYVSLQDLAKNFDTLKEETESSKKVLEGIEMLGVGKERWNNLIRDARIFSENDAYPGQSFPASPPEGKCVLCLQPLGEEAFHRLQTFVEIAAGERAVKLEKVETQFNASLGMLRSVTQPVPLQIAALLSTTVQEIDAGLKAKIDESFIHQGELATSLLRNALNRKWDTSLPVRRPILKPLLRQIATLKSKIAQEKAHPVDDARREKIKEEIANLKVRRWGSECTEKLRQVQANRYLASQVTEYCKQLNTRVITNASKAIEKSLVTDAFEERLNSELKTFSNKLPRLEPLLVSRPEKGEVLVSIGVTKAKPRLKPEQIFSEGERTALALAVFLADVGCTPNNAGIIFDDPVNSLDHRISKLVAKRLVEESRLRQVVVFTHSLTFYGLLRLYASEAGIAAECGSVVVSSRGSRVGLLESATPTELRATNDCLVELAKMFTDAKSVSSTGSLEQFEFVRFRFFSHARSTVERIVEDIVLNKVVTRRQDAVMTASLDGVLVNTETVQLVNDAMRIASENIDAHNHAASDNSGSASIEEMEAFLRKVQDLSKLLTSNKNKAETDRAHLKPKNAPTWK